MSQPRAEPIPRPWTPAETALLRSAYVAGGIRAAAAAIPDRTECAIYHRTKVLGMVRRRRWTRSEDRRLELLWGVDSVKSIAKLLKRTVGTVYWRAQKLGLDLGCPQGLEYLSHSTARTGFASTEQLRRVLGWAGVRVRRAFTRNLPGRCHHHVVDPVDVDEAIVKWLATETLECAGRRYGLATETVVRWLELAGVAIESVGGRAKAHRRVESATIDRVVLDHRAAVSKTETLAAGAARWGLTHDTLSLWLRAADVRISRPVARLDPADVDRVVRGRLAEKTCRAPVATRERAVAT